jgi:hypothetical protein
MTGLIIVLVIAVTVVNCFKAYQSARLLETDPEAWSRLQQAEDEKRRRRQDMLGKAILAGWRMLFGKKEEDLSVPD